MDILLAQENEDKPEISIYYLSKRMTVYELNYSTPEKRTLLSPRFAKWMMMISEYDITYTVQKSIKGSIVADLLADQPITVEPSFELDFPDDSIISISSDTCKLMFDGASFKHGYEIGILLIDPKRTYNPIYIQLEYSVTNNEVNGTWQVRGENLKPYPTCLLRFINKFDHVSFVHTPRSQNLFADALAMLALMTQILVGIKVKPLKIRPKRKSDFEVGVVASVQVPTKLWFDILQNYTVYGEYLSHFRAKERRAVRQYSKNYDWIANWLYRRSFDGQYMLYVDCPEAQRILEEVHACVCGPHMNGLALAKKILCLGYYCMTSPLPFSTWGIDFIGKIYPHASNGHEFILVAIDYFSKWVEASFYKILKSTQVAKFICINIIARYGVPHAIISDNGRHFQGKVLSILKEFKIEHHKSSPYTPQTNGAVEQPIEIEIPTLSPIGISCR
ncbi:uncharacterized protein LOC124924582 [Impatiens glandulifera]|uniref:uncharacterized protein LOC124924582 n=1 Tax=Impatiens glandulifera TaxID=253017 RepID=UPI001FB15C2D|nr:uncharacterized protein LOC124924582 [Impatiens glandulifera]